MSDLAAFYNHTQLARPVDPIVLDAPVPLEALHTPALIIDLDVFEANMLKMQKALDEAGIGLRAHTKMHKCPIIARKQIEAGANGVCAAKVSEAEIMARAGVKDILVTSPLASVDKVFRFIQLRQDHPGLKVVVDCEASARMLNDSAEESGVSVEVFIDIDPGMGRTGVEAGEPTLALYHEIEKNCAALRFAGLQMYAGNCMHIEGHPKRFEKYARTMASGIETVELFTQQGIDVPVVSGGGTGTFDMEQELGLINELQAGSYAFMDIEYRDIGGKTSERFDDFGVSLFVLVTAISQPQSRLITVDGGFKSFASDKMAPQFRDVEGVIFHWGGDEHGIVQLDNPSRSIALGNKLAMLTPHCDPTVNLHDYYFPFRDGMVSEIWPVSARGCSF